MLAWMGEIFTLKQPFLKKVVPIPTFPTLHTVLFNADNYMLCLLPVGLAKKSLGGHRAAANASPAASAKAANMPANSSQKAEATWPRVAGLKVVGQKQY